LPAQCPLQREWEAREFLRHFAFRSTNWQLTLHVFKTSPLPNTILILQLPSGFSTHDSDILPLPYLVPSLDHDDPAGNTFSTLSYTTLIAIEESSLFLNLEWLRPALFVLLIKQRWRGSRCLTA
jgi:hypothetical protein